MRDMDWGGLLQEFHNIERSATNIMSIRPSEFVECLDSDPTAGLDLSSINDIRRFISVLQHVVLEKMATRMLIVKSTLLFESDSSDSNFSR